MVCGRVAATLFPKRAEAAPALRVPIPEIGIEDGLLNMHESTDGYRDSAFNVLLLSS